MTIATSSLIPDCAAPMADPSVPQRPLPTGAWDCHCHVFGPHERFPYVPDRRYTPPDVPASAMYALHEHLGIRHAVLVQAACHGTNHDALLDAIAGSEGRYRGVALLPADIDADGVRKLHDGGVRGARLNFVAHLGKPPSRERLQAVVRLIAPFGWHLCVHVDGAALVEWLPELQALPIPFVVDHMARIDAAAGLEQPAMRALLNLATGPNAWVKISAIDRISGGRAPYEEGLPYVRALIAAMPERVLWGTDWPHPNITGAMPDDGHLVDLFRLACPDDTLAQRILTQNPLALYGN